MMFRGRVAAVSYLNTVPFIYGIEHAKKLHAALLLSPPSHCVTSFLEGDADIALIPVAAIPNIDDAEIITSYCIGASSPVRTVTVMTNHPIKEVKRIHLDSHSRTSALLTKILCNELWEISPEWVELVDYGVVDTPAEGDAFLLIGDKVFDYEGRFKYTYDLSVEWNKLTSLPFVFAAWVARKGTNPELIEALQKSLEYGVAHIKEAIDYYGHSGKPYAYKYLTENIDFVFDEQKRKALSLFWEKGVKVTHRMNPG